MSPNKSITRKVKSTKQSSRLAEAISNAEKVKAENPPGVPMPPEEDMSPAQYG